MAGSQQLEAVARHNRRGRTIANRLRWVVGFAALLIVSSAVPVLASEYPSGQPPESAVSKDLESVPLPDAQGVQEGFEIVEREEAARQKELESPEAVQIRNESREAFANLTPAASQELLSGIFSEQLSTLNSDPARFLSDAAILRPIGDTAAVVNDGGKNSLLESTLPIRIKDEEGDLKKVDLSLSATAEGFETTNSLTDVKVPASADNAIEVGKEGLTIASAGPSDGSAGLRFGDKNVFYPDVDVDTDLLVAPTAAGVELFDQLRSVRSPETLHFQIGIPDGAELRSDGNGGAEIAKGEETLASIPFPTAVDAQGTRVPVELQIEKDSIALHIAHREADVAYPLLVDPIVEDWANQNWFNGYHTDALTNGSWVYVESDGWVESSTYCIYKCWGERGLYISMPGGAHWGGQYGHWAYDAPNQNSYLSNAWAIPFWREDHGCDRSKYPEPHDYAGMWDNDHWVRVLDDRAISDGSVDIQSWGRAFVLGLGTGNGSIDPCWRDLGIGGVAIWLEDWEPPVLHAVWGVPTGWVSDTTPFTITSSVSDLGLGVHQVTITGGMGLIKDQVGGCTGLAASPCPIDRFSSFPLNGDSFAEGIRTAYLSGEDALGKTTSSYSFQMKVDRTPPAVSLDGQLAEATEEEEGDQKDPKKWDKLRLPVYNLKITATDGSQANNETRRSGVKSIEVFLDSKATPEQTWEQSCYPDSCSMSQTYKLILNNIATTGKHTLKIVATDQVGKKNTRLIEFEYFPATGMKDEYVMQYFPLPDGQGHEEFEEHPNRPELAVNVMNGNLVYREKDIEVKGSSVNLEVERYYNSLLPNADNTEWGDGWTLAQTPKLEVESEGGTSTARVVGQSGSVDRSAGLPTNVGEERFDSGLHATVTKEANGRYEIADESGESDTALAFDSSGKVEELRAPSYARIDYDYEAGKLSEIAVVDPAGASEPPEEPESEEESLQPPTYSSSFGATGTGNGQLKAPSDVAVDPQGNLWVADKSNNRVQKFNSKGEYVSKFGSEGTGNGQLKGPSALALDTKGNIWVVDHGNHRVQKFTENGVYVSQFGTYGSSNGQLNGPEGIAIDPKGNIYVSDSSRVQKFTEKGEFLLRVGTKGSGAGQISEPGGMAIGPGGNVWIADWANNRVAVFTEGGEFVRQFGSSGTGDGQFKHPNSIDVDGKGYVWVGDHENGRVEAFDQSGKYLTQFGSKGSGPGQFTFVPPMGIATDSKGNIWITDTSNNRVQKWVAGTEEAEENSLVAFEDDPRVDVSLSGGLVSAVQGNQAGQHTYTHEGDRLTVHKAPQGETKFQYDSSGRLTKVELPNKTYGVITYFATDGRVKSVAVAPNGSGAKTTYFEYSDEPRRTVVTPPSKPIVTYDIGPDGSVLKWWNSVTPPEFYDLAGTLYANRETASPITTGDHSLFVQAHSEHGIESIQVIANGNQLVDEETCEQDPEKPGVECVTIAEPWVMNTANWSPGITSFEVVITDRLGQTAAERFWVNLPYTPPPVPGAPVPPEYDDVLRFREEHGLDLDLKGDDVAVFTRVMDLIGAWYNPGTPAGEVARATTERWGVPLRAIDAAELEYRLAYQAQAAAAIPNWANANAASSYAGMYVDERQGGLIHVGFTEDQASKVAALKQAGGLMAPSRVTTFDKAPTRSLAGLEVLQGEIVNSSSAVPGLITRTGTDVKANAVSVGATDVNQANNFLTGQFGAGVPVIIGFTPKALAPRSRERNTGPVRAGDVYFGPIGGCTSGFGGWDVGSIKSNGEVVLRYFDLTVAHCIRPYEIAYRRDHAPAPGNPSDVKELGVARRTGFYHGGSDWGTDVTAIKVDAGIAPREIYRAPYSNQPVTGIALPTPGMNVCHSGRTSDKPKCGPTFSGVTWTQYEGQKMWQICFEAISLGGDSGGPAYIEGTGIAVGLLSSGSDEVEPNGSPVKESCFTPLLPIPGKEINAPGALHAPEVNLNFLHQ
jgi:YD repeat-containing protein